MEHTPAAQPSAPRPLAPFLFLWTTQGVSLVGSQAVQFGLIWWLAAQTGSPIVLATAAFAGLVPQVLLGPLMGTLVDRSDRGRLMLVADAAVATAAGVLAVLFALGLVVPLHIYVLLACRSIGAAVHGPAMLAATSLMVPERHLARIQGLNYALMGGLSIIGAPLGALLVATLPMVALVLIDVATALPAIAALAVIRVPKPESDPDAELTGHWMRDLAAGIDYLRKRRGLVALLAIASAINLCLVPAFSLLPLLVLTELAGDAAQLAWIESAFGIGTLAGGLLLGVWGGFERRILTSLAGLVLLGLAVLALGLSPAEIAAWPMLAMATVGLMVPAVNGPIQAIFQVTVPPQIQGRVFSVMASSATITAPVGLVLAAPVAELLGVRAWYAGGGLACIAAAATMALTPAILRIEANSA